MNRIRFLRSSLIAVAAILAGLLAGPADGTAQVPAEQILTEQTLTEQTLTEQVLTDTTQTVTGNAKAVQSTVLWTTTALADTGALGDTTDVRQASLVTGSIPSVFSGEVLRAATIGWPDQVFSEASLANLGLTVAGTGISADFVMARASAALGATGNADSLLTNLRINGVPVWVTGAPNQTIAIPGGRVVLNEQTVSAAGTTVNALHATVFGAADVVVASATAGIQ